MIYVNFNLYALFLLPIFFMLLVKWPKPKVDIIEESRVGIIRRISAFYIDLVVSTIGVLPIMCMPILILEFFETGQWQWSFERTVLRPTDIISLMVFLFGIVCIFYYFKWHYVRGRQTLGQHLLKFKLVPIEEHSSLSIRMFIAWVNFAWWPIWPWTLFKRKQDYWWDTASKIKARKTMPI